VRKSANGGTDHGKRGQKGDYSGKREDSNTLSLAASSTAQKLPKSANFRQRWKHHTTSGSELSGQTPGQQKIMGESPARFTICVNRIGTTESKPGQENDKKSNFS